MKLGILRTSIKELRRIADNMFHELENNPQGLYKNYKETIEQKFMIQIINKKELSDTWKFCSTRIFQKIDK